MTSGDDENFPDREERIAMLKALKRHVKNLSRSQLEALAFRRYYERWLATEFGIDLNGNPVPSPVSDGEEGGNGD